MEFSALTLIHKKLVENQRSDIDRFLIVRPPPIGLGGQITDRIVGLLLGLALGRKAIFANEDPPYGQTFEPLQTLPSAMPSEAPTPLRSLENDPTPVLIYEPLNLQISNADLTENLIAAVGRVVGVEGLSEQVARGAVFLWMNPTQSMLQFCQFQQQRIGVDGDTLGVHFRRGDKQVETAFVPASELNRRISEIYRTWRFEKLFIASDSPNAVDEISTPAGVHVLFDKEEKRYNNANHKMLLSSPELRDQETRVAFKNIFLLSQCGGIVGQDNAHFATISASCVLSRTDRPERIILVSGTIAEQRNASLAKFYQVKKFVRILGRTIFPYFTAAARMERRRGVSKR